MLQYIEGTTSVSPSPENGNDIYASRPAFSIRHASCPVQICLMMDPELENLIKKDS